MPEHGSFMWNELATRDVEKAKTFYGELLGWSFRDMDMGPSGTYTMIGNAGKDAGGMMSLAAMGAPDEVPPHWMSYIAVDDVDARTAKVAGLGGQVMREPFDIAGVGRMSVIRDATGAVVCLMTMSEQGSA
jgi:predicted enzyme related to lactoylglutathione lyase